VTTAVRVQRSDRLDADEVAEVLALMQAAGDADGAYPLSEHVVLHLRHGGDVEAVHLLIREQGELVGYAHVDTTDPVEGAAAELAVHPLHRRRGLGRALVTEAMAVADERAADGTAGAGRLRLWAHGDHPSATALAMTLGFERWRVLWQMRRSLFAPVPEPKLPDGVSIRPFRPGADDAAWVALNAAAFADHPDQGRWTIDDLHIRLREPWFDPAGFLLAQRDSDGELLGFHWTKVHGSAHTPGAPEHAHEPMGEVYVLGVAPAAHGTGLGTALTLAGLRHLRGRGLDQAMLYVDEANTKAVALYQKLGFARWSTDVCFLRQV
jgi:mycothiol synthase